MCSSDICGKRLPENLQQFPWKEASLILRVVVILKNKDKVQVCSNPQSRGNLMMETENQSSEMAGKEGRSKLQDEARFKMDHFKFDMPLKK